MTITENLQLIIFLRHLGIYLFEMTTTENEGSSLYSKKYGIYLFEMATTENGVRIRLANGIRYLTA